MQVSAISASHGSHLDALLLWQDRYDPMELGAW
jgi:hypothetical protein